jgi:hypothetical protein
VLLLLVGLKVGLALADTAVDNSGDGFVVDVVTSLIGINVVTVEKLVGLVDGLEVGTMEGEYGFDDGLEVFGTLGFAVFSIMLCIISSSIRTLLLTALLLKPTLES